MSNKEITNWYPAKCSICGKAGDEKGVRVTVYENGHVVVKAERWRIQYAPCHGEDFHVSIQLVCLECNEQRMAIDALDRAIENATGQDRQGLMRLREKLKK